jgi:hypothetical protein
MRHYRILRLLALIGWFIALALIAFVLASIAWNERADAAWHDAGQLLRPSKLYEHTGWQRQEWRGRRCRILCTVERCGVWVQFDDTGEKAVVSRRALRAVQQRGDDHV